MKTILLLSLVALSFYFLWYVSPPQPSSMAWPQIDVIGMSAGKYSPNGSRNVVIDFRCVHCQEKYAITDGRNLYKERKCLHCGGMNQPLYENKNIGIGMDSLDDITTGTACTTHKEI